MDLHGIWCFTSAVCVGRAKKSQSRLLKLDTSIFLAFRKLIVYLKLAIAKGSFTLNVCKCTYDTLNSLVRKCDLNALTSFVKAIANAVVQYERALTE